LRSQGEIKENITLFLKQILDTTDVFIQINLENEYVFKETKKTYEGWKDILLGTLRILPFLRDIDRYGFAGTGRHRCLFDDFQANIQKILVSITVVTALEDDFAKSRNKTKGN